MDSDEKQPQSIYVSRNEKMGSLRDQSFTLRNARFLTPIADNLNQAIAPPNNTHLTSHKSLQNPSTVTFRDWYSPQKKWAQWVDQLAGRYGALWFQTGICEAIISSTYEVRCNQGVIVGISKFWCQETNTFVFPWGEATITLEDVMILGGLPVFGDAVTSHPTDDLLKVVEEMKKFWVKIARSKARKVTHSAWLKYFMGGESEHEHVAFLSLWLSRYIFPSTSRGTIGIHVFSIAAKLSKGIKVALAPAFLASLYKNLRVLKSKFVGCVNCDNVTGPFQLLQLWVFERFDISGPNFPNVLMLGEPRVARWHKLSFDANIPTLTGPLRKFNWRPYAANVKNWRHPLFYQEMEQFVSDSSSVDEELWSFFRCLQTCKLVGLDCEEKYLPQRVAMQFGFDQDLPADLSDSGFVGEHDTDLFVPARSFQPGVSMAYSTWWKSLMVAHDDDYNLKNVLLHDGDLENTSASGEANGAVNPTIPNTLTKSNSERYPISVIPGMCDSTEKIVKSDDNSLLASVECVDESSEATMKSEILSVVQEKVDEPHFVATVDSVESTCKIGDGLQISRSEETHASRRKVSENLTEKEPDDVVTCLRDICSITKRKIDSIKALSDPTQNTNSPASYVTNDKNKKAKWAGEGFDKYGVVCQLECKATVEEPHFVATADSVESTCKIGDGLQISRSEETHASNRKVSENLTEKELDDVVTCLRDICSVTKRKIDSIKALSDPTPNTNSPASDVTNDKNKKAKWVDEGFDKYGVVCQVECKARNNVNGISDSIELDDEYDQTKECRKSFNVVTSHYKVKGGESFSNPIYVDDFMETTKSRFQKFGRKLGRRVPKQAPIILD